MSNELAVQLGVKETILAELTPTQIGWLKLELTKRTLFADMQKNELAIQNKLAKITEDKDLPSVQNKLKEAKEIKETSKGQRLHFTNMLQEKLIAPSMEFEKRNEVLIADASKHELALRTDAWQKQQADQAKDKEIADYKAFIINEYARKAATYRIDLNKMIEGAYQDCL